jgi:UDP-N-acetylmuramyl pentapeptide synthase
MPFAARYNYNISLISGEVAKTTFVDTSQSICSIGGKVPIFKVAANRNTPIILPPSAVRRADERHIFLLALL